ncbi:MAG TPA: ABC transporter permease [Bryobacteraceae bacterium]|jgi:putative ABC transport system permease protein
MSKRDDELNDEIRAHLEMAKRDRIARGESAKDAEANARRELGNELLIREVTRDMWGWNWLDRLGRDLKYAGRQMKRSPGFTSIAVVTLALGLGATTAMFSVVNGVLLEPFKYREPGRLYLVQNLPPPQAKMDRTFPINARHFSEWREHCQSCEDIAMAESTGFTLTGSGEPVQVPGLRVSYSFFRTLGVQPALGRDFLREEELPGKFHEVILTDQLWRSRFGADPGIVGRVIQVSTEPYIVVGVLPADLHLPVGWGVSFINPMPSLMFRPLGMDVATQHEAGMNNYLCVVRLKPGVQPAQTLAELNAAIADMVRRFKIDLKPTLLPLQDTVTHGARSSLWLLMGTVGAVLLIVCVNIGNLMLVRTSGRYREAGVRMALGASRGDLFRLVLTETIALVLLGGSAGLLLAQGALKMFVAAAPVTLPRVDEIQMDSRVFLFAAAAMLMSVLIAGLLPAWRLSRTEPQESLKGGSANSTETGGRLRLREVLVGIEVALSTILLIAGGLLMLSFLRVMRVDKGFEVAHVIEQGVSLTGPAYREEPPRIRFIGEALRRLKEIPGVLSAGVTSQLPLRGETWIDGLAEPSTPGNEMKALANFRFVSADYWRAIGIPLRMGRFIEESDQDRKVPAVLISERSAAFLWPGQNPVGRMVHLTGTGGRGGEVVGVVGEARAVIEKESPYMIYEPYWDNAPFNPTFVVRTRGDAPAMMGAVRIALRGMDPTVPITQAMTMEQVMDESVRTRRFQTTIAAAFAAAALALASLGIYGVISFTVARRTAELGIRIALGASAREVAAMVLRQGMGPVLVGLGAGILCAVALSRLIEGELFGVGARDPWIFFSVAGVLSVVAACACWAPARRAARIDPLRALRFE